jgi:MFS family permease
MEIPWALFRKAAAVLFAVALLAGFGATALVMGHRLPVETWRIVFIVSLIVLTITSTILVPGLLLTSRRSPHPEFVTDDLVDEWRDLQERRVTRPHILMLAAGVAGLVYLWCVLYYGKATNAVWFGWLPVGVAAIALALLLFAFARRTPWYHDRFFRTPTRVILIAFATFALALFLGIVMTEQPVAPTPGQGLVATGEEVDYGYVGTRAWYLTRDFLSTGGSMPDVEVPDCDGDECAYIFLFIIFLALAVVLVAGAALVPHMWVLSGLVLLTLIALMVLHEVRRDRGLVERQQRHDAARWREAMSRASPRVGELSNGKRDGGDDR